MSQLSQLSRVFVTAATGVAIAGAIFWFYNREPERPKKERSGKSQSMMVDADWLMKQLQPGEEDKKDDTKSRREYTLSDGTKCLLAKSPNLHIIDASWYLPHTGRKPREEFIFRRLPFAIFFDIDLHSSEVSCRYIDKLPHMLPSPEQFAKCVRQMGISKDDTIVIYDTSSIFTGSTRLWWTFKGFGFKNVKILETGLSGWMEKFPKILDDDEQPVQISPEGEYKTTPFNENAVIHYKQLLSLVGDKSVQIIDARSPGRYAGKDPEPRRAENKGHIPGAINLPFDQLLEAGKSQWIPKDAMIQKFKELKIDPKKKIITYCGSGITACTVAAALEYSGYVSDPVCLYDGSWAEWGNHEDTEKMIEEQA